MERSLGRGAVRSQTYVELLHYQKTQLKCKKREKSINKMVCES